jgi:hypothetical protein
MLLSGECGAHIGGSGLSILILGDVCERNRKKNYQATHFSRQGLPSGKFSRKIPEATITRSRAAQCTFAYT